MKNKMISAFKQDDKCRDQPDVRSKSQHSPVEATTSATGTGTPALIFLNYCYYYSVNAKTVHILT